LPSNNVASLSLSEAQAREVIVSQVMGVKYAQICKKRIGICVSLFTGSSVAELGPSCDTYIILWSRLDRHGEDVALVGLLLVV
jgi:hypothetical protein